MTVKIISKISDVVQEKAEVNLYTKDHLRFVAHAMLGILGTSRAKFSCLSPDIIESQLKTRQFLKTTVLSDSRHWSFFPTFQQAVEKRRLRCLARGLHRLRLALSKNRLIGLWLRLRLRPEQRGIWRSLGRGVTPKDA